METDGNTAIAEVITELICVIVNFGHGSKVVRIAKQHGILGDVIFHGKGTKKNHILEFLELAEIRKEIVWMAASKTVADEAIEALDKKFEFKKPYHGIAFTMPLPVLLGGGERYDYIHKSSGGAEVMYNATFFIVDLGKAEIVMDVATKAGARGGTIIKARGAGRHEISKLFSMDIEPEKEMVLILCESSQTERIATSVRDELEIDKPGKGIIFCMDVNQVYGLS